MKYDMAGGAAVIGAMQAIARLKPPIAVTGIVPAVENMPGSRAQRPGDIVTSLSGKTIEILNTDAEGRLILADAITYAKQLGCTHLIDAATLTGAIVVALGHTSSGVFTNNDELLAAMDGRRRKQAGEKMWHMPARRRIPRPAQDRLRRYPEHRRALGRRLHRRHVPQGVRRRHALGSRRRRRAPPGSTTPSRTSPRARPAFRWARL